MSPSERLEFIGQLNDFYLSFYNTHWNDMRHNSCAWMDVTRLMGAIAKGKLDKENFILGRKALSILRKEQPALRQKVKLILGV